MGKEQVAVNAINSRKWTRDRPSKPDNLVELYGLDQNGGLQPKSRSMTRYNFPKGKMNGGVIIDVDVTDIAVSNLGPSDVLTTHNLVECIGIALHMQQTQKEYFGWKKKPIPGTDRFLLAHLPIPPFITPPLRINELLRFAMREHTILGVGVSAQPYVRPLVESALNSWSPRLRGFNPKVVVIDEKGWFNRGVVITREGGSFLDPAEPDYRRYKQHSGWKWNT